MDSPDLHPLACAVRDLDVIKEDEIKKLSEAGSGKRSVIYYVDDKFCIKICRVYKVGDIHPYTNQEIKDAKEAKALNV
jgi:hypothetical protein